MNNEKFKRYTIDTIILLKDFVRKAKLEAANQKEGSNGYAEGVIMGYYSIITLLKHEAFHEQKLFLNVLQEFARIF